MYSLVLIFNVLYSKLILDKKKYKYSTFIILFFPIIIISVFLLGFQDSVGTDYENYKKMFEIKLERDIYINYYKYKGEILFSLFLDKIVSYFNIGQMGFVLWSFFQSFFLGNFIYETKEKYKSIIIFLLIAMMNFYQTQINVLRSGLVTIIFSIIVLKVERKKYFSAFIYSLIAINVHRSSFYILCIYLILKLFFLIIKKTTKSLLMISLLSIVLSFFLRDYLEYILEIIHYYGRDYNINSDYWRVTSFSQSIIKYYYGLLILYSLKIRNNLSEKNKKLYDLGFLFNCMRYFLLRIYLLNRVCDYFLLISIFPVYFLMKENIKQKKYFELVLISFYILLPYMLKITILAKGEYLYRSILF